MSPADWERLRIGVKERLELRDQRWPLWIKGTALAAAAASVIIILWQAGVDVNLPGRASRRADDMAQPLQEIVVDEIATSLGLAALDGEEIDELDDSIVATRGLTDLDLLVLDLTEEEEAELLKELEKLSSI